MKAFQPGDLVSTVTLKGETVYGIVITSSKRFQYEELSVLTASKVTAMIYDGRKGTIRLIQARIKNEKRTPR